MRLRYLSVLGLVAMAGGDPWSVNRTLQRGRPGQISSLAQAFHDAGHATGEAEAGFNEARRRFEAAWNRENGDHPINDAAEVQRATQSLGAQAAQLPQIAADLEIVAAVLAEAQRASAGLIAVLERRLEDIDRQLGEAYERLDRGHLSWADEWGAGQVIYDLEEMAIADTTAAVHHVEGIRDRYAEVLQHLTRKIHVEDGYDATPLAALDGYEFHTPEQAEIDVHAALAGDREAAARINAVLNSITADQRDGTVPLTAEQAAVLSQLQAQQHGMSVDALWTAEQRLGDQRQMIANSWQLMSNPAILFPKTELKPGAVQGNETAKGGAAQLPESVRQALDAPWSQYYDQVVGQILAVSDPTRMIADIVRQGNPAFQTNTDLDRRLIRRASGMMNDTFGESANPAQIRLRQMAFDPLVIAIFGAVSPDHPVIHDMLTGPDHLRFLDNITHHVWSDDGRAAASLFNWTETAARGPESRIAGEAAHAYGSYLGQFAGTLLHLPGHHTLGESNPELVRGLAHGLAPYVNNIAGLPNGLPEFGPCLETSARDISDGSMPRAKGIFAVLSSDTEASSYFNGIGDQQAMLLEGDYATALANHAPNLDSHNANLYNAMTLRGLVNSGIHAATQADVENQHVTSEQAQLNEYSSRKTAYEVGVRIYSAAAGLIPAIGPYAGAGLGAYGMAIESDIVGAAPTGIPLADHPIPDMPVAQADREILNALIMSGQHVPIAERYLINGWIASPDQLARTPGGFMAGEYDEALSRALTELFSQNYGNQPGRPLVPDLDMVSRYDAVVKDSAPWK